MNFTVSLAFMMRIRAKSHCYNQIVKKKIFNFPYLLNTSDEQNIEFLTLNCILSVMICNIMSINCSY